MNIIVDTNIVFSAMWNTNSRTASNLTRRTQLKLYSSTFLLLELSTHAKKIANKLQIDLERQLELQHIVTRRIIFIEEGRVSARKWNKAEKLTQNIDFDDIAFVALAGN